MGNTPVPVFVSNSKFAHQDFYIADYRSCSHQWTNATMESNAIRPIISEPFPYVVTAATKLRLMQEIKETGNVGEQYIL